MLYSYFKIKDKHYKTLDYIKNNLNSEQNTLSIKKKINKLNEYQFFYLFSDILYYYPINQLTIDTLGSFFEIEIRNINEVDALPFQDNNPADDFIPIRDSFATFNYTERLPHLIDYYLNTKEYPKETLTTKILVLSDKILGNIHQQVCAIKYYFLRYVEYKESIDSGIKVYYSMDIIVALENYEKNLLEIYEKIQEKISTISKLTLKTGNYMINIDKEILKKLYFGLEKFMFIDQKKTTLDQFIEVFELDWDAHNSIVYLEMDNIQFNFFIECIHDFFNAKIPITFIERSGNIENKNGKIKAKSVYASVSKSNMIPKDFKSIKSIFEEIKFS
ncbi:hypothetical protein [Flavobacterium laiguense]|uniref:Uncharacterized protein n=1 Tax=Flavobacterium laiguense TaxID=2169409 RepID=A0A2U1JLY9_9FLAO|nr:hypothetical protein [Flavobacterium laiguense]PWA05999.1 hypothetical protein DB891_16500 [Flavobacterium laiguense]